MSKPLWLVANWKMHGSHARVREFAYAVNASLSSAPAHITAVFCPPATYLETAHQALPMNARLVIGGQNCAETPEGAFTGGISAPMLKDVGASYVILGHSERRQIMGETDKQIAGKAKTSIEIGLTPIICVGETADENAKGNTLKVLDAQLGGLKTLEPGKYLIAYEPVWAIGTGKTPTSKDIEIAHNHIKSALGSTTSVLYGGSVKPANIRDILSIPAVNGALIGGASMEIEGMIAMIGAAKELR